MLARSRSSRRRRGATMVEAALVLPVLILILFGLIIGTLGIFRYQRVATLAREGARYASVRGGEYDQESDEHVAATPETIYTNAILPWSVGLDPESLSYSVDWDEETDKMPIYLFSEINNTWRRNHVTVTVSYAWNPLLIFKPVTLSSTSVMPLTY